MQLQGIIIFSLKHVIVRPTKIIKDLCKASTYDDMISYSTWFHAQLSQKILNGI